MLAVVYFSIFSVSYSSFWRMGKIKFRVVDPRFLSTLEKKHTSFFCCSSGRKDDSHYFFLYIYYSVNLIVHEEAPSCRCLMFLAASGSMTCSCTA
jgi:hypothetical protein